MSAAANSGLQCEHLTRVGRALVRILVDHKVDDVSLHTSASVLVSRAVSEGRANGPILDAEDLPSSNGQRRKDQIQPPVGIKRT